MTEVLGLGQIRSGHSAARAERTAGSSQNWRAKLLVSYRTIVSLISATTTKTGLAVRCELDTRSYPKGIRVSDEDMAALNIHRDPFHGEWNYTIKPQKLKYDAFIL